MDNFVQQLINGLTLGCIYGLLALSYTLIFGVLRVINFAIGETLMLGAFATIGIVKLCSMFGIFQGMGLGLFAIGLSAALLGGGGFALLTEMVAFRVLRRKRDTPLLLGLISSLGVAITAQNSILVFVDSGNVSFPDVVPRQQLTFFGASVTTTQLAIVILSLLLMACVSLLVYRSRLGQQIRAIRDNADLACEYGISPDNVIRKTFAISGVLAGFAGFAFGSYYGIARYDMGFGPGIKAFSAAILGGIGDVPGGVAGGILIGLVEAFGAGYVSAENRDTIVFAILILVLLSWTKGLLGRGIE